VSPGEFAHADDARLSQLLVRLGGDGVEERRRDELALHERHAVGCVRRQSPGAALAVHDVHVQRRLQVRHGDAPASALHLALDLGIQPRLREVLLAVQGVQQGRLQQIQGFQLVHQLDDVPLAELDRALRVLRGRQRRLQGEDLVHRGRLGRGTSDDRAGHSDPIARRRRFSVARRAEKPRAKSRSAVGGAL